MAPVQGMHRAARKRTLPVVEVRTAVEPGQRFCALRALQSPAAGPAMQRPLLHGPGHVALSACPQPPCACPDDRRRHAGRHHRHRRRLLLPAGKPRGLDQLSAASFGRHEARPACPSAAVSCHSWHCSCPRLRSPSLPPAQIFINLTGFVLTKDAIPPWWIWAYWVNPCEPPPCGRGSRSRPQAPRGAGGPLCRRRREWLFAMVWGRPACDVRSAGRATAGRAQSANRCRLRAWRAPPLLGILPQMPTSPERWRSMR